MHRESLDLPTWLIEGPEHEWEPGKCHSYDPDVAVYIENHYDDIRLPGGGKHDGREVEQERPTGNPDEDFIEVSPEVEVPNETPNETPHSEVVALEDDEEILEDEGDEDSDYDPTKDSVLD